MTAINERADANGRDHTTPSFEAVIAQGLSHDDVLLALPATIREKLAQLSVFVGGVSTTQAYKTLKSWPTHIPSSAPQQDFQRAIDEAAAYLERWMCTVSGKPATPLARNQL